MFVEFRVENHRSIRAELALTAEVATRPSTDDPRARHRAAGSLPLLCATAIYGANASGKSNLLSAMSWLQRAVVHSHRVWEPERGVPRVPFAWGPARRAPSLFEITFIAGDVRYQYGCVANDERFEEEWLFAWPNGRKQVWFERDGDDYKFGDALRGDNRVVERATRPNALFLSAAIQHNHTQLAPVYEWLSRWEQVGVGTADDDVSLLQSEFWLTQLQQQRAAARWLGALAGHDTTTSPALAALVELLQAADLGIVDVRVERAPRPAHGLARPSVSFLHDAGDDKAWLPLSAQSHGTRTIFDLAGPLLTVLDHGGLLLVDELEAGLHPLLAAEIIRRFNDPASNPNDAQIIFTTHDTKLLGTIVGPAVLRRDQVWLSEKEHGATVLRPLADFRPRKAENLERGYLQGRYGAIPILGRGPVPLASPIAG